MHRKLDPWTRRARMYHAYAHASVQAAICTDDAAHLLASYNAARADAHARPYSDASYATARSIESDLAAVRRDRDRYEAAAVRLSHILNAES